MDLMKLCGGESIAVTVKGVPYRDNYQYGVAVEDPDTGKPAVYLDMRQQKNDIQEKLVYML